MENLTAKEARNISENSKELTKVLETIKNASSMGKTSIWLLPSTGEGTVAGLKNLGYNINKGPCITIVSW